MQFSGRERMEKAGIFRFGSRSMETDLVAVQTRVPCR